MEVCFWWGWVLRERDGNVFCCGERESELMERGGDIVAGSSVRGKTALQNGHFRSFISRWQTRRFNFALVLKEYFFLLFRACFKIYG